MGLLISLLFPLVPIAAVWGAVRYGPLRSLTIILAILATQDTVHGQVRSVPTVDLERYAGLWHEIARLPNRFQEKCRAETTALYELLPGGEFRVTNTCHGAEGQVIRAEGRARMADRQGPTSRLKVRFAPAFLSFLSMVWGDYWILDLTDDYGAALVGTPNRKYLWVLSRTAQPDDTIYQRLIATAAAQGFDVSKLVTAGR